MKDLVILVADKNMRFALQGALSRPASLGIQAIEYKILEHPMRDGGVRTTGPEIIALEQQQFRHALLVMDFEGSGAPDAQLLEKDLDDRLRNIWKENAKAIVIEPELDVWMWGSDNALRTELRPPFNPPIRDWLRERGFEFTSEQKPVRPKEAMEHLLREIRLPRSSAIYEKIATRISIPRCTDPAFLRLRTTLLGWFAV
ncbi:MAG: hypothetical protein ABI876_07990 [Bacteroidota bacterium]